MRNVIKKTFNQALNKNYCHQPKVFYNILFQRTLVYFLNLTKNKSFKNTVTLFTRDE